MSTEDELERAIRRLPREIAPKRDLWPELEQQLPAQRPQRRWYHDLRQVAAVAFVLLGVLTLVFLPPATQQPEGEGFADAAVQISAELLLVQEYETLKAQQLGELVTVSAYVGDWHLQLDVWDTAVEQVRQALTYYPEDPALLAQMQGLYEQQLAFMHMIAAVDHEFY